MKSYFRQILPLSAFCLVCGQFIGCATKKAVQHTESSQAVSIVRDTLRDSVYIYNNVHVRDSVIIVQKGDTVFKDRWKVVTEYQDRWRDRWRTELVHDTIIKNDSIIITKDKGLTKWQRLKMGVGNVSFAVLMLMVAAILFIRFRKMT